MEFDAWVGKIPWRRKWQPVPIFSPGKSHGQWSPSGHSPWGRRDTTEHDTSTHVFYSTGSYIQYPVIDYTYIHGKNTKKGFIHVYNSITLRYSRN